MRCTGAASSGFKTDNPAITLPAEKNKTWMIELESDHLKITCNGVLVKSYGFEESTLGDCNAKLKDNTVKEISFGECDVNSELLVGSGECGQRFEYYIATGLY